MMTQTANISDNPDPRHRTDEFIHSRKGGKQLTGYWIESNSGPGVYVPHRSPEQTLPRQPEPGEEAIACPFCAHTWIRSTEKGNERAVIAYQLGAWLSRTLPTPEFGLLVVDECLRFWRSRPECATTFTPPTTYEGSPLEWFVDQYTYEVEHNNGEPLCDEESAEIWFRRALALAPAGHRIHAVEPMEGFTVDPNL